MKKIWTFLVAAITVLAVLTSGCGGSGDKAAKPADGKKSHHYRLLHLHAQQPLLRIRTQRR